MKRIIVFAWLWAVAEMSFAQTEKKKEEWIDNLYIGLTSSTYLDILKSPLKFNSRLVGYDASPSNPDVLIPRYKSVPYQSSCWNFFSLGIEPRYNFHVRSEDEAFALSMPISFGIGQTLPENNEVGGKLGFGSLQVPLFLKYYIGNGATYDSEKMYGLSVGAGIEYNKLALVSYETASEYKDNGFVLPVFSLGFHTWRNNSPFEVNIKYGHGKVSEYDIDYNGNPLRDANNFPISRKTRASSFKITFVNYLNY